MKTQSVWLSFLLGVCLLAVLSTAAAAQQVAPLALSTNDMVYDRFADRLYASVPGSAGSNGNSIAVINPHTAVVENYVWVGSEPNQLALSDDGRYLYVGLDGAYSVRRVTVATLTADLLFSLGTDWAGGLAAYDLAVLPGDANSVAVVRKNPNSTGDAGVAIYTGGVMRPHTTTGPYGARLLAFSASSPRLYGFDNSTSAGDFWQLNVDANGVTVGADAGQILTGTTTEMFVDRGALFASSGEVIDPEALTAVGRFPLSGYRAKTATVDQAIARYYTVSDEDSGRWAMRAYDLRTFRLLWSFPVEGPATTDRPTSLVQWAPLRFAYRTSSKIFLVDANGGQVLRISKAGTGEGGVASVPAGISCGTACAGLFAAGTSVSLAATPAAGSRFVRWDGDADCGDGVVTVSASLSCTAVFSQLTIGLGMQLPLTVNDVVYSPLTGRIYASIPGRDPVRGNTITVIDPVTGDIGTSVWVGSEPGEMAVSSDGGTMYVAIDGATAVRRVDLVTLTPGQQFQVGRSPAPHAGRYWASRLAVQPGHPDSVLIARKSTSGYGVGIALYTNGSQQGAVMANPSGEDGMVFSDSASRAYAIEWSTLYRLNVTAEGVSLGDTLPVTGDGDVRFSQGRLYFGSGLAFEPESATFLGTYPVSFSYFNLVAPSPDEGLVYFVTGSTSPLTIPAYDLARFTFVQSSPIPDATGFPSALVVAGPGRLALATDRGQFFLYTRGAEVSHGLWIESDNPASGVPVETDVADLNGDYSGVSPFLRRYNQGSVVTLTAPATVGRNTFKEWLRNGNSLSTNRTVTVTMTASARLTARYSYPPPVVASITPAVGSDTGGTPVTIKGADFRGPASVSFSGTYATSVVVVDDTTISAVTPAHAAGPVDVRVRNSDSQYATLAGGFTFVSFPRAFSKTSPAHKAGNRAASIELQWSTSASATAYEYCVDTSDDSQCDGAWVPVGTALTSGPLALDVATTYYWQVRATNTYGTTQASDGWWRFRTGISPLGLAHIGGDVDGDRTADLTFWRPGVGLWYSLKSGDGYASPVTPVQWGTQLAGDVPVPGDYDGDGRMDYAVWRPSTGTWWILLSGSGNTTFIEKPWGLAAAGDTPVPGDYDGDGKTDLAFWRPAAGTWWVLLSGANYTTYLAKQWGVQAAGDIPAPGDYDGDGKMDLAFWRPSAGAWWVLLSESGYTTYLTRTWGTQAAGDRPMPGDYDGDGRTDMAVWRPSTAVWWVLKSSSDYTLAVSKQWGTQANGDVPVPADYDGDGVTDIAFWRPTTGAWWILQSSGNFGTYVTRTWGTQASGDMPVREKQ